MILQAAICVQLDTNNPRALKEEMENRLQRERAGYNSKTRSCKKTGSRVRKASYGTVETKIYVNDDQRREETEVQTKIRKIAKKGTAKGKSVSKSDSEN
jgi:hypothetical protein